jgi:hypothetical protein
VKCDVTVATFRLNLLPVLFHPGISAQAFAFCNQTVRCSNLILFAMRSSYPTFLFCLGAKLQINCNFTNGDMLERHSVDRGDWRIMVK